MAPSGRLRTALLLLACAVVAVVAYGVAARARRAYWQSSGEAECATESMKAAMKAATLKGTMATAGPWDRATATLDLRKARLRGLKRPVVVWFSDPADAARRPGIERRLLPRGLWDNPLKHKATVIAIEPVTYGEMRQWTPMFGGGTHLAPDSIAIPVNVYSWPDQRHLGAYSLQTKPEYVDSWKTDEGLLYNHLRFLIDGL